MQLVDDEYLAPVTDSFAQFMKGVYRVVKFNRRFYRSVGKEREAVTGGWIDPHYETIDASVFRKWRDDANYRPENIKRWADARGLNPATLGGDQDAQPQGRSKNPAIPSTDSQ